MPELHNPYPGIRPFRTEEGKLFFGREDNIAELRERLSCRFLSIVGTSGSGKSSLVRAGLIPSLMDEGWIVGTFRPQGEPIKNLVSTLKSNDVLGDFLPANFAEGQDKFEAWDIVDYYSATGQEKPLVLVVDQFEEIFRFNSKSKDAKAVSLRFVDLLIHAISQNDYPIYVIITLRSEFLGRCSEFHGLTEWINKGQYLVPRMTRPQFERAITGFKDLDEYKDVNICPELVSKLLSDIGDDTDQLPVLQHALMMTWHEWEKGEGGNISIDHYLVTGEMRASVSAHAEDILRELKYQGLEKETRTIFQRITEIDYDSNKVRNPTRLSTLIELTGGKKNEVITIVEAFRAEGRNFLRPDYQVDLEPDIMIDVAHESLIRQWRTLGKWMREEADNAREYRLINLRRENQETEGLLMNPRLAISNYWWIGQSPTVLWASRYHSIEELASKAEHKRIFNSNEQFLEDSLEEQEKIDEANKTELERKKEQRFQRVTYLTAGLVIIALILGLFSRRNQILKNDALELAEMAKIEAALADSARLAADYATNQALREKTIADSLRADANQKSLELIEANLIADQLKDQAIDERQIAESRSIDARIAELGALISESRAKSNEIEANILKLTSEYKEQIEEAKKQALVSIIMEDPEEQRINALASFEKYNINNRMLMGLQGPVDNMNEMSIDYYVNSIDSVRRNMMGIIRRANDWILEIDPSLDPDYQTFRYSDNCDLNINMEETTSELLKNKRDSIEHLKSDFESTCLSVDEIRTDREWETLYPTENHRALLESYTSSFGTGSESITYRELIDFLESSIEINFQLEDVPNQFIPKYLTVKGIDQVAYSNNEGTIVLDNQGNKKEIRAGTSTIKLLKLFDKNLLAVGQVESMRLFDFSMDPARETIFEESNSIISLEHNGDMFVGLNESGRILTWTNNGDLIDDITPSTDDLITSFDCHKYPGSSNVIIAVGTNVGRVHLFRTVNGNLTNTGIQLNRLYSGEEPAVKTLRFSPDGQFLASANSRQLDLWPLAYIDGSNEFQPIFQTNTLPEQIDPIPMGRNESIQTSKGLTGISFSEIGDFIMFTNNSLIFTKPINIYFLCRSLGSDYCAESELN